MTTLGTLVPLVISVPSPTDPNFTRCNGEYDIAPILVSGHVYTRCQFPANTGGSTWVDYIFEHSSTDGSAERTKLISDICSISANNLLCDPAFVEGTDNNLYAITTTGNGSGIWWLAMMCLSKIDPSTLAETATIVPYAVAHAYDMSSQNSFQLTPFQLNSVNYVAVTLSDTHTGNCNIEVINVDTMTSLGSIDYHVPTFPSDSSPHAWCLAGQQISATHQVLYIWMSFWDSGGEFWLYKIDLNAGVLSASTIVHNVNTYTTSGTPMFDPTDNNIVLWVTVQPAPNPSNRYLQKISTTNGSVLWQSIELPAIPGVTYNGSGTFPMQSMGRSDLTGGQLIVCPGGRYPAGYTPPWTDVANEGTYLTFDTADGSYVAASSPQLYQVFGDNFSISPAIFERLSPQLSNASTGGFYLWVSPSFIGNTYPYYTADWIGGWVFVPGSSSPPAPPPMPPAPTLGRDAYYIERMDNRLWDNIEDAWCLDAALQYPMPQPAATITASSATGGANIATYAITNGGSGYTAPIAQVIDQNPNGGSGATLTVSISSGVIVTATPVTIGSGYLNPIVKVLDATGTGAFIQPVVTNYVTLSTTTSVFTTTSVGDIVRMGGGKLQVVWTGLTTGTTSTCIANVLRPITAVYQDDPNNTPLPATSGNWSVTTPVSTVSGLDHLEGMSVSALADGAVVGNLTVVAGSVTLPVSASSIVVGLPFIAQLQTLYMEAPGGATMQTRRKNVVQVVCRAQNSAAPELGVNQPDQSAQPNNANVPWTGMTQVVTRTPDTPPGQAVPLFSGDFPITNVFGEWNQKGQIAVQQTKPVPLTVTALIPWVAAGDTPG